jgi:hypothetical protein
VTRIGLLLSISACQLLAACEPGAAPGSEPIAGAVKPFVSARTVRFDCDRFPGPEYFTKSCAIAFQVDAAKAGRWTRLGCFGQLKYSSVNEGRVGSYWEGFYQGVSQDESEISRFSEPFKLQIWVYFPKSYEALDPSLDWYKCEVIERPSSGTSN